MCERLKLAKCTLISADACGCFAYLWVGVSAKRTQGDSKFDEMGAQEQRLCNLNQRCGCMRLNGTHGFPSHPNGSPVSRQRAIFSPGAHRGL